MKNPANKYLYAGFVLAGLFSALLTKNFTSALSFWGIAFAFNPWSQQNWKEISVWQKAIFFIHFFSVISLTLFWITIKFLK